MHEKERHRIILSAVQDRPVVTVAEMLELTGASEATIRRDVAALHLQKKLRRVRGGAESISPPQFSGLAGRPFSVVRASGAFPARARPSTNAVDGRTSTIEYASGRAAKRCWTSWSSSGSRTPPKNSW